MEISASPSGVPLIGRRKLIGSASGGFRVIQEAYHNSDVLLHFCAQILL
mgnify:CR=1 FL=1